MTELVQMIRRLSQLRGVSGNEDAVRAEILSVLRDTDCAVDPLGNVLVFKEGNRRPKQTLLFSAHMDEVGYIITHIEDSGRLRFAPVGGIDSRVAVGRAVEIGDAGIPGVIGLKATHHATDKEKETPTKIEELTIDIGAGSREDAAAVVSPGDRAVFAAPFRRLGETRILGRAFDDRAGCALLLALAAGDLPYDCHFAFTVQEETGCTGAVAAGYTVNPDIAVAVEATTASDIGGVEEARAVCRLGQGPVLSFMDRGTVYDRGLFDLALQTAGTHSIPVQVKEGVFGGNESRALQTARGGSRVLAVNLPCRYLHSPSCMLDTADVEHTFALLGKLVGALGEL